MNVSNIMAGGMSPMVAMAIAGAGMNGLEAKGTTQADATQLPVANNLLDVASAPGSGVKLPRCEPGSEVWIRNETGQTVDVYPFEAPVELPAVSVTVNGNASLSLMPAKTALLKAITHNYWAALVTA
jgi:hypothetical protein